MRPGQRRCACAAQPESHAVGPLTQKQMRRSNIHAAARGAARVQPSLNPTSRPPTQNKYEASHHAAPVCGAARVQPSLTHAVGHPTKKKNMRRSNIHAAGQRRAARVQPSLNPTSVFNAKKNKRRSTFIRGLRRCVCSSSLNPRSRPSNAKNKETLQHSCVARGAARVQPSLNPRSRSSTQKNIRRSNIHAARPAALRVRSQPESHAVGPPTQNI
jgi:hypothetical protein